MKKATFEVCGGRCSSGVAMRFVIVAIVCASQLVSIAEGTTLHSLVVLFTQLILVIFLLITYQSLIIISYTSLTFI